ncbi:MULTISPECIES: hypothetical protein [Streptomyces]|uniref:DUF4190 domain-containing protein n=1 Tax=Streptomyces doudnae TaxID=3075536 RepID=A0ABD5EJL6_9ACTN|nr:MULTISPECIES: hypothetical protein [unclassified Streptomyces]MDT0434234.1 hypothetical protein [Streptomyces sp. DSM 41981]MYQ66582.1 hypothetical protein [Streptomyces sp. SID4950]SCE22529.1 hypothetical protein GA0115242_12678 [Streptomyces sp. SolWspMP-5a-2]
MSDRSLRLLTPSRPVRGGEPVGVLRRDRPSSSPDAPSGERSGDGQDGRGDDNPFAPPPEGTPDRPWQPRRAAGDDGDDDRDGDRGGSRSPWGRNWSDRQPGRSSDGFGSRPGAQGSGSDGPNGPDGPDGSGKGPGQGMRWDPTDPVQRRARLSLLTGMWAFFFALFGWLYVGLMLGALSLYWGISSLRATSRPAADAKPGAENSRPQTTAAISGLVTSGLALVLVAGYFTAQLVYSDYYTCSKDALTNVAKQSCAQHLPKEVRGLLGAQD